MNNDTAYELIKICLMQGIIISAPLILMAMGVGIVISLFQTVTSIQEQTLTFVPKVLAAAFILWLIAPWILESLGNLMILMFSRAGEVNV
ncbi:MAG: flagellar biosynthetic protein FliQ [Verrucomicrobiota bacterium]